MTVPGCANPLLMYGDAGVYQIERSLRFNSSDSAYLSRTPAVAGNRRTWTWAGWVKRTVKNTSTDQMLFAGGATSSDTGFLALDFISSDKLRLSSAATNFLITTAVYRDAAAWMHIVLAFDAIQGTNANKVKLYVNGTEVTAFDTDGRSSIANQDYGINQAAVHEIGRATLGSNKYFDGYLADIHFIDGQALTPSSFTEVSATTGQLVPKAYTGSFGTNGFHLPFSDNSATTATTLGKDTSGNGNNWTPFNLQTTTGGPTSVAAASGALPIYNTTDIYGTVKGSGTRTDSNSSSIVLAVPMQGTNGGTTFTDESATIKGSGSAKTLTRYGDTITSTAQSRYYGSSTYFDGSGDYLTVSASNDFSFGSGNFTIECWLNTSNTSTCDIFGYYSGGGFALIVGNPYGLGQTAGTISIFDDRAGGDVLNAPGGTVSANTWTHIAAVRNGSDLRIYCNGVSVASKTTSATTFGEGSQDLGIGRMTGTLARNVTGYIQDFRVYKGVAKYTSSFNPPSATQNPTIAAGNDSLVDTPTSYGTDTSAGGEVRGNYCTLNPLAGKLTASPTAATPFNGNLEMSYDRTSSGAPWVVGTIAIPASGKWYWEYTITAANNSTPATSFGVISTDSNAANNFDGGGQTFRAIYNFNGNDYKEGGTYTTYASAAAVNDVIGIAVDMDAGSIYFHRNGSWANGSGSYNQTFSGAAAAFTDLVSAGKTWVPLIGANGGNNGTTVANFGQRAFAYTAPSGFKALCDTNLPAPVVAKPNMVMDVVLYSGTGSNQTITGLNFNPDFVWLKRRSSAQAHYLYDVIRGTSSVLYSDGTDAEQSISTGLTAFNSNGFSLGSLSGVNASSTTNVAWTWDAGSSTVTNTQGSITSSVRANPSSGFSIVTYQGNLTGSGTSTVGHGLGVKPSMIITKKRSGASAWTVQHASLATANTLIDLNSIAATYTSAYGTIVAPTSSVFTIAWLTSMGDNGADYVAYCFAPVTGYSSFGSYTGNGSADGVFIYTGHRSRWIMIKRTNATQNWYIFDAVRNTYNAAGLILEANLSDAELDYPQLDILSNGFKLRGTDAGWNASGSTYVFASFAESPFQYARAR